MDSRVIQNVKQSGCECECHGIAASKHHDLGFVLQTPPCCRGRISSPGCGIEKSTVDDWMRSVFKLSGVRDEIVDLLFQNLRGLMLIRDSFPPDFLTGNILSSLRKVHPSQG